MYLAAVCLIPAGCALLSPPKSEPARALLSRIPDTVPHERKRAVTLLVPPPETSAAYDTTRMAYIVRPYQLAYFRDNEWAETPAQMVQPLLVQTLEKTGYFQAVLTTPANDRPSLRLQTSIVELVQDHTVSPPVVRIVLRLEMLGASGQPIADREITVQKPMPEDTPYAGVIAMNDAIASALQETARFATETAR